jgi:putative membrane protein
MVVLWVKVFHIVAVIAFMAGMLYLPRLFVYHVGAIPGGELSQTLKTMERRLYSAILTPAIVAVWISGPWLAYEEGAWSSPWLHAKIALVVLMTGLHGFLGSTVKTFAADKNVRSAKFYRILNEVPTGLMILIVALVVLKPF